MKRAEFEILIFAKAPVAGSVKTRLAPQLGAEGAARLHEDLLRHTLAWTTQCVPGAVKLYCAPTREHEFFRHCAQEFGVTLHAQHGHDLGQRMARALSESLKRCRYSLLIGSDCPAMDGDYIREALQAFRSGTDMLLGPAEDGGYVAIGMREAMPELFRDIAWGGDQVLRVTRERIRGLARSCHELPLLWDLDRPEDLRRFRRVES